jgi:hypothetical protein
MYLLIFIAKQEISYATVNYRGGAHKKPLKYTCPQSKLMLRSIGIVLISL